MPSYVARSRRREVLRKASSACLTPPNSILFAAASSIHPFHSLPSHWICRDIDVRSLARLARLIYLNCVQFPLKKRETAGRARGAGDVSRAEKWPTPSPPEVRLKMESNAYILSAYTKFSGYDFVESAVSRPIDPRSSQRPPAFHWPDKESERSKEK